MFFVLTNSRTTATFVPLRRISFSRRSRKLEVVLRSARRRRVRGEDCCRRICFGLGTRLSTLSSLGLRLASASGSRSLSCCGRVISDVRRRRRGLVGFVGSIFM